MAALAAGLFCLWLVAVWPPPSWYRSHWPAETAFMRMRGGHRLYRPVPLDSIAPAVAQAVMVGEDQNFKDHGGIDYSALLQALGYSRADFHWTSSRDLGELVRLLPHVWARRAAIRGASTITQQLAKNLYLSPSRNPLRKVKEAVTAYRLEAALGKQRILELYLNVVELGDGVWGVEAASRKYFARSAQDLSREQAAAISGSLPFPLRSNPGHRPARMRWRQELILRRMQGEQIEVPREVEDAADTAAQTVEPAADSSPPAASSETEPVAPADSTPPSDSAER
jgi:monofunctional biosynthetic peptidoglycan transglycosylase